MSFFLIYDIYSFLFSHPITLSDLMKLVFQQILSLCWIYVDQ